MANEKFRLIFGGGNVGLMGEVSTTHLDCGGEAVGITPKFLARREKPLPRDGLTLRVVKDMHTRKGDMFKFSDGFIVLAGGVGTLEEAIEQITWRQLGRHQKPIILVNTGGFWDPLRALLDQMETFKFIREDMPIIYNLADDPRSALDLMSAQWARTTPGSAKPANDEAIVEKFA
ncbi:MAG: hypothetical protein RIQ56_602 [Candidatus Parcubacteria bacterium]|jgi:uncharacterized protein (TIGR00730 family)